jgi:selenocysteine-specific elongation factor
VGAEIVPSLCLGTAGHIDHGKTWLVRALTGKDTDRLPEEQARGISIDLGYAPLDLPDGRRLSLIDVPGHERFIRNMVAGATGIDLFLLVIDAAEGAREQTHEHLAILSLLGIDRGVVAVTKADAVAADTLELAVDEARELVPGADVIAVSAKTGAGLDELRTALAAAADSHERRRSSLPTRLFVDRVFTLRGIGTIATGTLWSGSIGNGDELRVEPRGLDVRVRSVQVHDESVERAVAGQRVALSLPGVERTDLARGDVVAAPGTYPVSYRLDVLLDELEQISDGAALQVHHGTAELAARVVRIGPRHAQLRLAAPAVAARGDHVVLRRETTVGGGRVLDPRPPRASDPAWLDTLERGEPAEIIHRFLSEPKKREEISSSGLLDPRDLDAAVAGLVEAGGLYATPEWLEQRRSAAQVLLSERARHFPLDPGVAEGALLPPRAAAFASLLGVERRDGKAYLPGTRPELGDRTGAGEQLESELAQAGVQGVKVEDVELGRFLEAEGRLVRLGGGHAVAPAHYARARDTLIAECEREGRITLARFRDLLGISRRPAQLLLERFDTDGITRRVGDERILRRSALPG